MSKTIADRGCLSDEETTRIARAFGGRDRLITNCDNRDGVDVDVDDLSEEEATPPDLVSEVANGNEIKAEEPDV